MNGFVRPLILVRGFGGPDVSGVRRNAYQGFNDGTVYPEKQGENYIYEGFVLRAMKSTRYPYRDATNVVGYYPDPKQAPADTGGWDPNLVSGPVVLDRAMAEGALADGVDGTLWIYRYYDLVPRSMRHFGLGLVRLLRIIEAIAQRRGEEFPGVDIVAHSMGGLVVREALKQLKAEATDEPERVVHRVVTLGTPHRGIAFQYLPRGVLDHLPGVGGAADELAAFGPDTTEFLDVGKWFPLEHILTVVGTNYRSYGATVASWANRLSNLMDDTSLAYNRSDGLVKQSSAQLPGAPRTFVNKCHGGSDSLVTSREAFEIAMRFFHGTHGVRLWLDEAKVLRGKDLFGRSEFYFGVSIKPRFIDFELFRQDRDAENCYGPFHRVDLSDGPPALERELTKKLSDPGDATTGWAGPDRLIWQGWIDARAKPGEAADEDPSLVLRLDVYVGERDTYGIGFSDNVVFRKQYYLQLFPESSTVYVHTGEELLVPGTRPTEVEEVAEDSARPEVRRATEAEDGSGWRFEVGGTGFEATLRVALTPLEAA